MVASRRSTESFSKQRPSKLEITHHALMQYKERFGKDERDLRISLERALPFGVQYEPQMMLLDGNTVFVICRGVVKTCLTKKMAIANIEYVFQRSKRLDGHVSTANIARRHSRSRRRRKHTSE